MFCLIYRWKSRKWEEPPPGHKAQWLRKGPRRTRAALTFNLWRLWGRFWVGWHFRAFSVGGRAISDEDEDEGRLSGSRWIPADQSVGRWRLNLPVWSRVCQKHLFYSLRGKPAVTARATPKPLTRLSGTRRVRVPHVFSPHVNVHLA